MYYIQLNIEYVYNYTIYLWLFGCLKKNKISVILNSQISKETIKSNAGTHNKQSPYRSYKITKLQAVGIINYYTRGEYKLWFIVGNCEVLKKHIWKQKRR